MSTLATTPIDTTLATTLARIKGQNPDHYSDDDRVGTANRSNDLTLRSMADIMARTPEAQKAGLGPSDIFTYLVHNGNRAMLNKQSAQDLRQRGVAAVNTSTGWADSIIQTLKDRLMSTGASHPILGPQIDFKGPPSR